MQKLGEKSAKNPEKIAKIRKKDFLGSLLQKAKNQHLKELFLNEVALKGLVK